MGKSLEVNLHDFRSTRREKKNHRRVVIGLDFTDDFLKARLLLRKITLLHESNAEAGLGKDHHTESILQEMGAGMRSKNKKKAVLDLLIHPANTGKTTKTVCNVIFLDYLNITGNLHH
jgi:hypothetical protein